MTKSSHKEIQGEATQSFLKAIWASHVVNVYENISYAMPGILDKPKWVNTLELEKPKIYRNQIQVQDDWDNIHDPHLTKNPKYLREGACERMKASKRQI